MVFVTSYSQQLAKQLGDWKWQRNGQRGSVGAGVREPVGGGGFPGWQAASMQGDLVRFVECFQASEWAQGARKMPEGLLRVLTQVVGKQMWKEESELAIGYCMAFIVGPED